MIREAPGQVVMKYIGGIKCRDDAAHASRLDLTWILEEGVPDAGAPSVLQRVPLHLVRRRRRPEDEARREVLPGEVVVLPRLVAMGAERQGEDEEEEEGETVEEWPEEQWRSSSSRHDGGQR